MPSLPPDLRNLLERAVVAARELAEAGAQAALTALAVDRPEPFAALGAEQRALRVALRARARQLGEGSQTAGLGPLREEIAYTAWHRLLFARVLAENGLLMHPSGVAVTLADCADLAAEEGEADAWTLAARYVGAMLPGILPPDSPAARVALAAEHHTALVGLIEALPPAVFTADDALGWVYQYWQKKRKDAVNKSEVKIGAAELPAVTQLFTEDYMVRFLLENSLGAWWAARHPASPLLGEWDYLRYADPPPLPLGEGAPAKLARGEGNAAADLPPLPPGEGTPASLARGEGGNARSPAAGCFPGWPQRAAQVTVLDPCCGSGHFLVRAFEMLRHMRMEEEGLAPAAAAEAVLRDNLYGLELDPRCAQLAAFALALAAWKAGGHRPLPLPQVACVALPRAPFAVG